MNPAIATTAFVLDNSVLCGWILANQATPYSDAIAGLLPVVDAHAPWLLQLEFTMERGRYSRSSSRMKRMAPPVPCQSSAPVLPSASAAS